MPSKKSVNSTDIYFGESPTIKLWKWLLANKLTRLKSEYFRDYNYILE